MGLPIRTSHLIGNVVAQARTSDGASIYPSRVQMIELIGDTQLLYGGGLTHHLVTDGNSFQTRLKRIDLVNAGGVFELLQGFF